MGLDYIDLYQLHNVKNKGIWTGSSALTAPWPQSKKKG